MIKAKIYGESWDVYNCSNFPYNKIDKKFITRKRRTGDVHYLDAICTMDSECSTINDEAVTYIWGIKVGQYIVVGRYWKELQLFMSRIKEALHLDKNHKMVIYVHNLAFDYKFFSQFLEGDFITFPENSKKLFLATGDGFEFRCSLALTSMSLEKWCEQEIGVKYKKLSGTMDYTKKIYPDDTLKRNDFRYFLGDIISLYDCLECKFNNDKEHDLAHVPLTMVGYVREYVRNYIEKKDKKYYKNMQKLTLTVDTYNMLSDMVSGGDCSCDFDAIGEEIENVKSYDLQSSYPYVMLTQDFPMSSFIKTTINDFTTFENYLDKYCCMFKVKFSKIELNDICSLPIISVCKIKGGNIISKCHGRLIEGEDIELTLTETRYKQILKYYNVEGIAISDFYFARKGKLPKAYRDCVYTLYKEKCDIKKQLEKDKNNNKLKYAYRKAKERLNALFGMCLTEIVYGEDIKDELDRYNRKFGRFLFYAWGIWVVDHAKTSLYSLADCCDTALYWDTDCIKSDDFNDLKILAFNATREIALKREKYFIKDYVCGAAELDGEYELFKTLGPKQYIVQKDGILEMTCSGVSKDGVKIISSIDDFAPGITFNAKYAGCQATYIDSDIHTVYTPSKHRVITSSSVVIKPSSFTISEEDDFLSKAFFTKWEAMD